MRFAPLLLLLALFALLPHASRAQCGDLAEQCGYDLLPPFNSDGQFYRVELYPGEVARLKLTFYAGVAYRLLPCCENPAKNPVVFTLYDRNGTELYSNQSTLDQRQWDFAFGATSQYTLTFRFAKPESKGCIAIVVGYREISQDPDADDELIGFQP